MTQRFSKANIDFLKTAPTYQKRALTHATRIDGPFIVETSEGEARCEDGYLALDSRGFPYPIAKEEFEAIYMRVGFEERRKS